MKRPPRPSRGGFTLAEVAVTLVIVATVMVLVLQGINEAKLKAAQARNIKLARELAVLTLGRIGSALYMEEIRGDRLGPLTYAEEGYPDFEYEVVFGGETFLERDDYYGRFDSWHYDEDDYDDEDAARPYEEVEIKVTFPPISGTKNELVLKTYLPWEQVYGAPEDELVEEGGS